MLVAALVLAGIGGFWCAILVAAALEPGYRQRRDYVSVLAAHGAEHPGLAILAIVAAAGAMLFASLLLWQVSRMAGLALALAGVGFVVVAFTRLDCPNGAAACGLGGRFEISGSTEIGHWTATTVSTVLVIVGMALTGLALLRRSHGRGRRHPRSRAHHRRCVPRNGRRQPGHPRAFRHRRRDRLARGRRGRDARAGSRTRLRLLRVVQRRRDSPLYLVPGRGCRGRGTASQRQSVLLDTGRPL